MLVEQFVSGIFLGTAKLPDGRVEGRRLASELLAVAWNASQGALRSEDGGRACERVAALEVRLDELYDAVLDSTSIDAQYRALELWQPTSSPCCCCFCSSAVRARSSAERPPAVALMSAPALRRTSTHCTRRFRHARSSAVAPRFVA